MKKIYTEKKFKEHQKRKQRSYKRRKKVLLNKRYLKYNPTNSFINSYHTTEVIKQKKLSSPSNFSLISNSEETLKFFHDFFTYIEDGYNKILIDMRKVEDLTIEVLLYIISLDKIYKEDKQKIAITIKVPRDRRLIYLIAQSGFTKYFHANINIELNENDIFPICDGQTNSNNNLDDADTCRYAVDFVKQFIPQHVATQPLYNALAEMMTNVDNHAYDEISALHNWYLFAVRVKKGIAFYFFDNGKGITNTAKKNLKEKMLSTIKFGDKSLMEAVLNGEYRSQTKLPYRNKGLPEIKDFLMNNIVISPIIITNKILCSLDNKNYTFHKMNHNFRGSLFVWIIKVNEDN